MSSSFELPFHRAVVRFSPASPPPPRWFLLHPLHRARAAANQAHLRLMETTDIHVNVFPLRLLRRQAERHDGTGTAIIDTIRAEAANSLLIDNGDLLQGNPMGDYMAYQRGLKDGDVHPVIKAMNTLGYTVGTLGITSSTTASISCSRCLVVPTSRSSAPTRPRASSPPIRKTTSSSFKPYVIVEKMIKDGRQREPREDRLHRLRSAADHALGHQEPRGQGADARYRRGGQGLGACHEGSRRRYRHRALARARRQRPHRQDGERLVASGRAVDGIDAIFTGHQHLGLPGPKTWDGIERRSGQERCMESPPSWQVSSRISALIDLRSKKTA